MKKFKAILSVVLSLIMLVCCTPIADLVSAEKVTEDTVYTIFAAVPESFDVGRDVTRRTSALASAATVTTAVEDGTAYYSMSKNMDIQWHSYAFADSGLDYITNGTNDYGTAWTMAWINSQDVVTALNGLVDVSCDVRVTQTTNGTPVNKVTFYIAGSRHDSHANQSNKNATYLYEWMSSSITSFGTWNTISAPISTINSFNMAYIAIKSDLGSKPAQSITVATDVRNIKLTVKESNRQAINDALAATGYDFEDLIAPYLKKEVADPGVDHVIYKANPFRAGTLGTDVSVSTKDQASRGPVEVKSDDGGVYFSYTDEYAIGQSAYNRRYYYNMGYDDKYEGLGWMASNDVAERIMGKVTASIKVRINANATSGSAPQTFPLYYGIFNKGQQAAAASNQSILITTVRETNKWIEISNIPVTLLPNFYSGYACVRVEPTVFNGTVTVDMKDFKLTINSNDKEEIDTALADTDYDFDTLIATYSPREEIEINYTDYTIWEANPDNLSLQSGESVKASLVSSASYSPKFDVIKMTDDGSYYRTNITVKGSGGDNDNTVISSGIRNNSRGYGWLEDVTVLQTLRPFMTVSFEYRVNASSGSVPSDGAMYIYTAHAYSGRVTSLCSVNMANATDWTEYSVKLSGNTFANWYSGYLGLSIYSHSRQFDGSYNIDLRNFHVMLNSADKLAINEVLKNAGSLWTFDDIVQTDPDFNSHNVIWYASPERLGAKAGDNVTGEVNAAYLPAKYETYVANELGVDFYRTEMKVSGKGGDQYNAVIKTGFDSNTKGFGWMANKDILNAMAPYMYITFDYRLTSSSALPEDAYIHYGAASKYGRACKMGSVKGSSRNWKKVELSLIGNEFTKDWSEGYFTFNLYSSSGGFSGTQIIDIRNIRIEFRDCDRLAINDALCNVSGMFAVKNFTSSVIKDRDESGSYNYYNILINWLPNTEFDANDDDILDIRDLVRMKKITVKAIWVSDVIKQRLDCDGDDNITSTELVSIRKTLLNQERTPYINDPLKVGLVTEHPGVVDMDAYYKLYVTDKQGNEIPNDNVIVSVNSSSVTVNGYNLTVPYSVRSADEKLTVTVISKTDSKVFGRYDFKFVKFTDMPTLQDDFNSIDTNLWSEMYTGGEYTAEDGKLKLTTQVGQNVGLTTKNVFEQAYGSFSAKIKMPEKALVNGAFWLFSNTGKTYRRNPLNPSISGGEIDIVEYFPTWTSGTKWSTTVHWNGSTGGHHCYSGTDQLNAGVDLGNDYHVYSAVWMKDAIYNYLDGVLYRVYDGEGLSDHSDGMQIIFSMLGESEDDSWGGTFNAEDYPDSMYTDWLKVYGLSE